MVTLEADQLGDIVSGRWSAATAIRTAKRYEHIGSQALRDAADVVGGMKIPAGSLKKSPRSPEEHNVAVQ
jgi:hypothetical protein